MAITVPARGQASLQAALDALHDFNVGFLRTTPGVPPLYVSGVRYAREPRGCNDTSCREERFDSAPIVLARGWGDCDDLAPWRSAELEVSGIPARPLVYRTPASRPGSDRWHVIVLLPDGSIEDPSRLLGMGR